LWVTTHKNLTNAARAFIFGPRDGPLKTVYTYRKAKVFADGVALGRELTKESVTCTQTMDELVEAAMRALHQDAEEGCKETEYEEGCLRRAFGKILSGL